MRRLPHLQTQADASLALFQTQQTTCRTAGQNCPRPVKLTPHPAQKTATLLDCHKGEISTGYFLNKVFLPLLPNPSDPPSAVFQALNIGINNFPLSYFCFPSEASFIFEGKERSKNPHIFN